MRCGVVIVGAGKGERLGGSVRKAMVPLGGRPLILHAAAAFAAAPSITSIVLVLHPDDAVTLSEGPDAERLQEMGISAMVPGGARRQDSVLAGIGAIPDNCAGVMVHDAARPFVSVKMIEALAACLDDAEAAVPVVPATSTVKRVSQDRVVETVPRDELALAQTPQAARRDALVAALDRVQKDGLDVTDDVQAIEVTGGRVVTTSGSAWNFKVTTPADLALAEIVLDRGRTEDGIA